MRLSEAILLGSLVLKPLHGQLGDIGTYAGCALGMAHLASGCTKTFANSRERSDEELKEVYPILGENVLYPACGGCEGVSASLETVIVHLFDSHVMQRGDWTIDRLAQWVDSVDPTPRAQESAEFHDDACQPEYVRA